MDINEEGKNLFSTFLRNEATFRDFLKRQWIRASTWFVLMSVGLHLAALESGSCTMPSITRRPNSKINLDLMNDHLVYPKRAHLDASHNNNNNGSHAVKEYSLINHIENLKAAVNGNIPFVTHSNQEQDDETPDASTVKSISPAACHPNHHKLVSITHLSDRLELNTHSNTLSKWATDPDSVPGNLRSNLSGKSLTLTLEEIISGSSSSMAKRDDDDDDNNTAFKGDDRSTKKNNSKNKRKSAKCKYKEVLVTSV